MHSFDQRLKIPLGVPACMHAKPDSVFQILDGLLDV